MMEYTKRFSCYLLDLSVRSPLAQIANWNLHVQRQYTTEYQVLETNNLLFSPIVHCCLLCK